MTAEDRVNDRHGWTAETSPLSRALAHRRQQVRTGTVPVRAPRPVTIRPAKVVPGRRSLPCIHEGAVLEWCTCNDEAKHVRDCDKHERCTRGPGKLRSCATCSDYDAGQGSPLVFHIAAGIGDTVSALYAACGLADATGRRVDLHSNHPTWLAGVEHPGVRILSGKAGPDLHRRYNDQLVLAARNAVSSRSQWYADQLAAEFGIERFAPRMPATVAKPDRIIEGDYVVLSPFSNWANREWPVDRWRELASGFVAEGTRVIVLGQHGDASRMKGAFSGITVDLAAGRSASWVLSVLAHSSRFIGNDSGMAHLSALYKSPTFTVQSQLLPEFVFAPGRVRGVTPDKATWPCTGCGWRVTRGYSKAKCDKGCLALLSIGTERVRAEIDRPEEPTPESEPMIPNPFGETRRGDCHPELPRANQFHMGTWGGGSASVEEATLLRALVLILKPTAILETGTETGWTAAWMASACRDNGSGKVYTVETSAKWVAEAAKNWNREGLSPWIEQIHGDAFDAIRRWPADRKIQFALIDTHIGQRLAELDAIAPLLDTDAVVAIHDTSPLHPFAEGHRVLERLRASGHFRAVHMPSPRGLTLAQKR